jgi:hypothetical protein
MAEWDTNWETSGGKGKLTRKAYNQLQAGIAQRSQGARNPVVGAQLNKYQRVTASMRLVLHNKVSELIVLYTNHTVNGGNYNGQSTIPEWTEADILTAIGDDSRLPAPSDHINVADWNNQTRKIINLLRWVQEVFSFGAGRSIKRRKTSGSQGSWASAKSAFDSAGYTGNNPYNTFFYSYHSTFGSYSIDFNDTKWNYTTNTHFKHSTIMYFPSTSGAGSYSHWFTFGLMANENKYNSVYSIGEQDKSLNVTTDWLIENGFTSTPYPPEPISLGDVWMNQLGINDGATVAFGVGIRKFDGPNGFTYKDW